MFSRGKHSTKANKKYSAFGPCLPVGRDNANNVDVSNDLLWMEQLGYKLLSPVKDDYVAIIHSSFDMTVKMTNTPLAIDKSVKNFIIMVKQ